MASMAAKPAFVRKAAATSTTSFCSKWRGSKRKSHSLTQLLRYSTIRASHSMDDKNKVYKQLGLFSLKKKIEDAVLRAEMLAPTALELEEARRNKQEAIIRDYNLWDDPAKSNEILTKLGDSSKVVDSLKDLTYKVEEAKLITQLAEIDAINFGLFKQAYNASLDVSKVLDQYEMSKLLKGPYDMEGACVIIRAGSEGYSEIWASRLLSMYIKWAKKQGYKGRVVEKCHSPNGGIRSATIEFEFEFAYGFLSGEKGVHYMIRSSSNGSALQESSSASAGVDVIPLFLNHVSDQQIDDADLIIASPSVLEEEHSQAKPSVRIQHIPTGISVHSSGERSQFANKIKALNRLKAKLLVIAWEQGISTVNDIKRDAVGDIWQKDTRKYMSHPHRLVEDVKTGIQLPDPNSVLDGNLETLIGAHINTRQS
ncbi:peptide chain release factor PrfB3, chloroplastic isoform X1 [Ziziphus jujuba]|uniref:Peptide chain release factor PrfB3, chloroplastic isoform X1 n=2 Tax=Ziziphus jujuba TaxID=326968 RepID=A0A6P4ARI8_ZIZJJ|nr:peptide chain release factor PrfB3, chloroplastic isoform X1 [Ziziphus jujuba]